MDHARITVKGAREHNLKNVSLSLPHGKLICFTGVSGSGKSSFAFDTLFAEGQRRYLESLSSYARQFLGQLAKPDVDQISGLSPSVSIQQKSTGWNPRSTVGTITQIQDYLRVLFARIGQQHCPNCGQAVQAQSREQIVARILELPAGSKIVLLAPVIRGQKGEYRDLFDDMRRSGYARARVDGTIYELTEVPALTKNIRHHIEIVIDRLVIGPAVRTRLAEAVESALKLGQGSLIVAAVTAAPPNQKSGTLRNAGNQAIRQQGNKGKAKPQQREAPASGAATNQDQSTIDDRQSTIPDDLLLSANFACAACGLSFEPPSPQLFSFNSPQGMCQTCDGLGETFDFDPQLIVPDPKKSFLKYAVEPMRFWGRMGRWKRHIYRGVAQKVGFDLNAPWEKLPKKAQDALLYGLGDEHVTFEWRWSGGVWTHGDKFEGVLADLRDKHKRAKSGFVRSYYEKYMRRAVCHTCQAARLNPQALAVRLGATPSKAEGRGGLGESSLNICHLSVLSIRDALTFFESLKLTPIQETIARDAIKEIKARLGFLCDVGLDYLTLDRAAPTLSGGESQRIRLASQIGAGLVGVLYVLDEPSIGLHARDNQRLLDSLCRLRDMGNTVIVVEHDEQTMRTADYIVDFGPGPGVRGGEVVGEGTFEKVLRSKRSITGQFLRGDDQIEIPPKRRPVPRNAAATRKNKSRNH